jgi:hydrogenase nickel incorporation protein HypA/HybF
MHETGIVQDLVHRLERTAGDAGAQRVVSARVWLGALTQFSAEHFREHFEEATRNTIAHGAALDIEISTDPLHPSAQHVVMQSVELEV